MDETALHAAAIHRLDAWGGGLPPHLAAAWRALRDDLHLAPDAPTPYFLHPMALPVVQLPGWASARWGPAPEGCQAAAAAAAVAGYLYVRVRDDHLDDGAAPAPPRLLLSDLLRGLHHALLVEAGGPEMLADAAPAWARFSEAMLEERALEARGAAVAEADFARLLDRAAPLTLPARAVLRRLGAEAAAPALARLVRALVDGHQRLNDLVDVHRDLRAGARTRLLVQAGVDDGPAAVYRWLFQGGGVDTTVAAIEAALDEADGQARELDLAGAAAWLSERRALVARIRRDTWAAFFAQALGGPST